MTAALFTFAYVFVVPFALTLNMFNNLWQVSVEAGYALVFLAIILASLNAMALSTKKVSLNLVLFLIQVGLLCYIAMVLFRSEKEGLAIRLDIDINSEQINRAFTLLTKTARASVTSKDHLDQMLWQAVQYNKRKEQFELEEQLFQ